MVGELVWLIGVREGDSIISKNVVQEYTLGVVEGNMGGMGMAPGVYEAVTVKAPWAYLGGGVNGG